MRLSLLHLPGPIAYSRSLQLQEVLLNKHFAHKALLRNSTPSSKSTPPPNPTLLTFQSHPTYTVGRRHLNANPLSQSQIDFLTTNTSGPNDSPQPQNATENHQLATFYPSPRGGLLTYHAPGQLTAYLILNLRTHHLTPRCYIRALENTVIRTCARHDVPNTGTTDDPGVWVTREPNWKVIKGDSQADNQACQTTPNDQTQSINPTDRKICAIGVQVSRGITSHGIGLNVFDSPITSTATSRLGELYKLPTPSSSVPDEMYTRVSTQLDHYVKQENSSLAPGYLSWGFSRIVACGLEGKSVTWLSREQSANLPEAESPPTIDGVAHSLAVEVCNSLGLDPGDMEITTEEQVLADIT